MLQDNKNTEIGGCYSNLDTIAQPVHQGKKPPFRGNLDTLRKKAQSQYFSKAIARKLSQIPNSPLNKGYRRTLFDCATTLIQEGQKLTSRYCNGRWCNTCNRIRTAKLTVGYKKALEAFKEPYFVTLTIPNCPGNVLREITLKMIKDVQLIIRSIRRKEQINGIRKLECTYNFDRDDYHPHFHLIVDGKNMAELLVKEWLVRNKSADLKAQHIRPADENGLAELFKYVTKIVSKSKRDGYRIHVKALDVIFQSFYGLRTFQPFGNVKMVSEDIDELKSELYDIPEYESVVWSWYDTDWYNMLDGNSLTGYEPSESMKKLVTEKMQT
jgi:hypothetical protein